jgi:4-hydroxybenzoate polyprenyltransferase
MEKKAASKSKLLEFFKLIRFVNLVIVVLTQYLVRLFIIGTPQNWKTILVEPSIFLIALSTVCIAAAGYIINDYYDIKIDVINKPDRVVIDRSIHRRNAIIAHFVLNVISLVIGYMLSLQIAVTYAICIFFLWLYSNQLKRLPLIGNFTVALLTAISILVLAMYYKQQIFTIYFYAIFAFLISLVREVIKDMEDIKGDLLHGCHTLPIVWGLRKTKGLLYVLLLLFIAWSVLYYFIARHTNSLLVVAVAVPLTIYLGIRLWPADRSNAFRRLSTLCKVIMALGSLSIVFIR